MFGGVWLIAIEGEAYFSSTEDVDYPWEVTTWNIEHTATGVPTFGSFVGGSISSAITDTVSVDHTAVPKERAKETTFGGSQSITIQRDIEPLLSEVSGGASVAYSHRDLNDKQGNNKVVRVRRASDNAERDFLACLLYTSPSPRDGLLSRMPSSA